jgi:uncharacterized protein involved in response to NO
MPALFAYGFRPNFLLAGLAAAVLIPVWAASLLLGEPLGVAWPTHLWHGHEMLFGFVGAAIAGFLLTAVPSWTGQRGWGGWPLVALTALWLAGRATVWFAGELPPWLVGLVDAAFLPAVALLVAPPLFRTQNRNRPLLLVLIALSVCNVAFHWVLAAGEPGLASRWLHGTVGLVLVLVTVIGGRIIPAFTSAGLRSRGVTLRPSPPWLEGLTLGSTVLLVVADIAVPGHAAVGVLALTAGLAHAARALHWSPHRTGAVPLVWVLHAGYAWVPAGLLLKGIWSLTGAVFAAGWLHALTVGALATLILAVMTRASLGHTGRPLVVGRAVTAAYLLLLAAAAARVFGPVVAGPLHYGTALAASAALWTAAFAAFVAVYGPILMRPRADGKPG